MHRDCKKSSPCFILSYKRHFALRTDLASVIVRCLQFPCAYTRFPDKYRSFILSSCRLILLYCHLSTNEILKNRCSKCSVRLYVYRITKVMPRFPLSATIKCACFPRSLLQIFPDFDLLIQAHTRTPLSFFAKLLYHTAPKIVKICSSGAQKHAQKKDSRSKRESYMFSIIFSCPA